MVSLVIGEFGTGFVTDEMLSNSGIKDELAQHKLDYVAHKEDMTQQLAELRPKATDLIYPWQSIPC